MLLIIYDFANDKQRAKFAKLLKKYGQRVQYSAFEIKNSPRILNKLILEIEKNFKPKFTYADSIRIYPISPVDSSKTVKYGWAVNEDSELLNFFKSYQQWWLFFLVFYPYTQNFFVSLGCLLVVVLGISP